MNEILWDAELQEEELRTRLKKSKQPPSGHQLTMTELFGEVVSTPEPEPTKIDRPTVESIADEIYDYFKRTTPTRGVIYRRMANSPYFSTEVNKAITLLKKQKRAQYDGDQTNDTIITFR